MIVSFDVWNTLLDLRIMLEGFKDGLSQILGVNAYEVKDKILDVRTEIKELRKKKGFREELLESQKRLAKKLGCDIEIVKRAAARATLNTTDKIVLDGVKETLKNVQKKGHIIITLGNVMFWPSTYTRLILERFYVSNYIKKQFYSDEFGVCKPMPEFFEKALSSFDVPLACAIHVGDTKAEDFFGAIESGLLAVWINPDAERIERIHERGFVVKSIKEVLKVLDEVEKTF